MWDIYGYISSTINAEYQPRENEQLRSIWLLRIRFSCNSRITLYTRHLSVYHQQNNKKIKRKVCNCLFSLIFYILLHLKTTYRFTFLASFTFIATFSFFAPNSLKLRKEQTVRIVPIGLQKTNSRTLSPYVWKPCIPHSMS